MAIADTVAVTNASLVQIERRIMELERVRAVKAFGSLLYELDTGQIERLRAIRDRILTALGSVSEVASSVS